MDKAGQREIKQTRNLFFSPQLCLFLVFKVLLEVNLMRYTYLLVSLNCSHFGAIHINAQIRKKYLRLFPNEAVHVKKSLFRLSNIFWTTKYYLGSNSNLLITDLTSTETTNPSRDKQPMPGGQEKLKVAEIRKTIILK